MRLSLKCQKCFVDDFPGFNHFMMVKDIRSGAIHKLCWECIKKVSDRKPDQIWHELYTEFEFWPNENEDNDES